MSTSSLSFVLLVLVLLGLCETTRGSDGVVSPRLKLFTIFSTAELSTSATSTGSASAANSSGVAGGESNSTTAGVDMGAVKAAESDFVIVASMVSGGGSGAAVVGEGLESASSVYKSTDSKQILYQKAYWKLIQEGSFYEELPFMWARFQSATAGDDAATACLGVAKWDESWTDAQATARAASLVAYVNSSCKAEDVVALALTSPVSSGATELFEGKAPGGAKSDMMEAAHLLHEQQYVSSSSVAVASLPSATSSRLFLRLKTTMCIDKAATPSASTKSLKATEALALELCTGQSCHVCKPASLAADSDPPKSPSGSSGSKHTIVIVVSCSVFLLASLAVFAAFFRNLLFAPSERSKEEKDITTNLAYVLTI